ncbi:MAG: translation elongation factor 4 [Bacteroidota bacterium]
MKKIRNFCIIAHIDHGKSTLADRLLEATSTISAKDMRAQLLDDMDLERERGITIKSHAIQMHYTYQANTYVLNLIDTPGHVDFSYEVSRAIAACEGALLIVDASQGIEAQTIANLYLAMEHNLTIIPVLNKIDLAHARAEELSDELVDLIGCEREEILQVSAKEGTGIAELLQAIITRIPHPEGDPSLPLKAMIFDAVYNPFTGVNIYFRIFEGTLTQRDAIRFLQTEKNYRVEELGILKLKPQPKERLSAGDVGYLVGHIKNTDEVKIGSTLTHVATPCQKAVAGFAEVKPMLFAGIYPISSADYELLRTTLQKLQLNDAALIWEPETSVALGYGFRCGFLGFLHMEIIQERLAREFQVQVITTVPSVQFKVTLKNGDMQTIQAPADMPTADRIAHIEEPIVRVQIITKADFIGPIIALCINKRGMIENQSYLTPQRVELIFKMPLAEIVFDFFDKLKSVSKGYASLDYSITGFEQSSLVKLDILLNGQKVDALSAIVHRSKAYHLGKNLCQKLKEILPRHLFEVPIQASIGHKVIARETVKQLRKDVTAKLYGGDITRKKKLREKQKKGKKRMGQIGSVQVPQEAFFAILKVNE